MKKIVQLLLAACLLLMSQVAYADEYETLMEGADITAIQSFAMGKPLYSPQNGDPTMEELEEVLVNGLNVDSYKAIGYQEIALDLLRHKNIDLSKMDRRTAARVFATNTAGYADAYVIVTVARNSRTIFFFDVYKAGTDELLYTYRRQMTMKNTRDAYQDIARDFYQMFFDSQRAERKKATDKMLDGKKPEKGHHKGRNEFKITDARKK